jgi:hypothetical protein
VHEKTKMVYGTMKAVCPDCRHVRTNSATAEAVQHDQLPVSHDTLGVFVARCDFQRSIGDVWSAEW